MNIEKFLEFWSAHNTHIIELLIAAVLLSIIYLAFRTFFGENAEIGNSPISSKMNPEDLQRTLQKIIETQSNPAGASSTAAGIAAGASASATAGTGAVAGAGADPVQLEKLKTEIQEREKTIQTLKDQIQQLGANQGAAAAAASKELESKLKDLEARLAEYEIISEDIADITFYKEENTRLQKELAAAKSDGGSSSAPAAAAPASAPQTPPSSAAPASAAPVTLDPVATAPVQEPVAAPVPEMPAAVAVEPVAPVVDAPPAQPAAPPESAVTAAPAAEAAPATGSAAPDLGPIDDDLMKEFASAVEEQKAAAAAAKQAAANKSGKPGDKNLMGEFENFMKKG